MEKRIAVVTDSNSGITQAEAKALGIHVVPTPFFINGELFLEDITLTREAFFEKLDDEHKKIFKDILKHNKEALKIIFVFVDVPSSFKKYEYEEWYRSNFDTDDGIWIGFGVTQQFVIKLSLQSAKFSNIDSEYAVIVKNGMPIMIKVINEFNKIV